MPDNRKVQCNGVVPESSNRSLETVEEAVRGLKIQKNDNQENGAMENSCPYPDRPGQPNCNYYLRTGLCGYGSKCRYNHPASAGQGGRYRSELPERVGQPDYGGGRYRSELPERVGQPDCGHYLKTGTCRYGSTCKYHHPQDKHSGGLVPLNTLGLPLRQEENACPFYMKTGLCKYGVACKFHHPQPPGSAGSYSLIPGPAAYGSPNSSAVPSSGLQFVGVPGLTLPTPRAPYMFGPYVQEPQSYMPVFVSPSQGIAPAHGWNTYLNQGESIASLPQRPDQPECRNFLSTGSCKYGSDCKYHHPKEKIGQFTTSSLGPIGLPLRPGQPVCSYYCMYGMCPYGPTCKYDHPLVGYSYNYGLSSPSPVVFDPSVFPYPRNSPTVLSSEASPPKLTIATDLVRKPEAAVDENQKLDAETPENSSENASTPPHPMPDSSELSHDQSD